MRTALLKTSVLLHAPSPSHTYERTLTQIKSRGRALGSNPMVIPVNLKITRWDGKEP